MSKRKPSKRFSRAWIKSVEANYNVKFKGFDDYGKPFFAVDRKRMHPLVKKMSEKKYRSLNSYDKDDLKLEEALEKTDFRGIVVKTRPPNFVLNKNLAKMEREGEYLLGWDGFDPKDSLEILV